MSQSSLEPLHRLHPYCARFPSEIVESFLERYSQPGDSVFDPFCGSGTTLVAGLAHKRRVIGSDIDTLAGMLSEVKCASCTGALCSVARPLCRPSSERLRDDQAGVETASEAPPGDNRSIESLRLRVPEFPELTYWFPPQVIAALGAIATAAHECQDGHLERVALISLSASIIAKWPHTLSYAMDIDHTRPHRRVQRLTLDRVLTTYIKRLDRTLTCLGNLHGIYRDAGVLEALASNCRIVYPHDAREPLPLVPDRSQALVITSPPYFNAVDYPRAHRMSLCWMNGYAPTALASRQRYVGLRYAGRFDPNAWLQAHPKIGPLIPTPLFTHVARIKRLCAFFADLEALLIQAWRVLRSGGHALFVIANNVIKGERVMSHTVLGELAKEIGFVVIETAPRAIASLHRRFPVGPFGFDGPMTHEYLVVLRKPYP